MATSHAAETSRSWDPPRVLVGRLRLERVVRWIGWFQVVGAAIQLGGLAFSLGLFLGLGRTLESSWPGMLANLLLFALALAGGIALLRGARFGVHLSILVQALQVVCVAAPWLVWRFVLGPHVTPTLAVDWHARSIFFLFHSGLAFEPFLAGLAGPPFLKIGVNLLALAALFLLVKKLRARSPEPPREQVPESEVRP